MYLWEEDRSAENEGAEVIFYWTQNRDIFSEAAQGDILTRKDGLLVLLQN